MKKVLKVQTGEEFQGNQSKKHKHDYLQALISTHVKYLYHICFKSKSIVFCQF